MARYERDSDRSSQDDEKMALGANGLYSKVNSKLKREALKARLQSGPLPHGSNMRNSDGSLPAGRVDNIVKTCLQDPEAARREQMVKAMREKELIEKEQIFLDDEEEEEMWQHRPKMSKSS